MKLAVLGAGNGGLAVAADVSLRTGSEVRLYNRSPDRLTPIREKGGIELVGEVVNGFTELAMVSTDLEAVLSGVDLVIVSVPTDGLKYYAPALAPILSEEQIVWLNPGHMGGSLFFAAEMQRRGRRHPISICETTTLTYACRLTAPASIQIFSRAANLLFAGFPASITDRCFELVAKVFPDTLEQAESVLQTGMQDLNAVEHPAQMLCNSGWIEYSDGDFYFYLEGTTRSVARLIEAVDEERVRLCRELAVPTLPFVEYFHQAGYTTKEGAESGSVFHAMQQSAPNRTIKAPPTLDHRYLHEDVGWGLVPWAELARLAGVEAPTIEGIIHIASVMTGVDYPSEGLTLERMGLSGFETHEAIREYVLTGPQLVR